MMRHAMYAWLAVSMGANVVRPAMSAAADPKPAFQSAVISPATPGHSASFDVALNGAKELYLVARDGGDGYGADWADWAEPRLVGSKGELKLTDLKPKAASADWGEVRMNANASGGPLRIAGKPVSYGIGTHANSLIGFDIPAGYDRFVGTAGIDNGGSDQGGGSVQFAVYLAKPAAFKSNAAAGSHELADALAGLDVADDLQATLFAGEPILLSPSNIDVDHLGRVWVCEVVNYRRFANKERQDRAEGDRIIVLEDTNGDGQADKSTTFYQGRDIDSAHGVCVLGDRVIISAGDSIFSLYDRDGDLKADSGSKEIMFTGISGTQHDHGIHSCSFGFDGRLYFNFGNDGRQLKDKHGQPVVDLSGRVVSDKTAPYQEGMVFRCDLDGSNVETLGWNFRNNWEVCVDSFGAIWQSDNDDDGNRGVRINFVMEFGNYGYKDEFTRAGWTSPRTNMETEIPLRHWHLNDPGVVPNLLQTGAGSPTGIMVYEGDLLPPLYRNQVIHCDAGPNVVRAYPVKTAGAGYTAEMANILEGTRDKWFRPSDVCVAPDGSLIVADWYDPGVGGHRQGDVDRGRLFRVAPTNAKLSTPKFDFATVEGSIAALKSPNLAARYLAWQSLAKRGDAAKSALLAMFRTDPHPRLRSRALGVLVHLLPGTTLASESIDEAFKSDDANIRMAALRLARKVYRPILNADGSEDDSKNSAALLKWVEMAIGDADPAVRREGLVAFRTLRQMSLVQLWVQAALKYQGDDRWMLEALGIAAEGRWDEYLPRYLKAVPDMAAQPVRDVIWRSRSSATAQHLVQLIQNAATPESELPRTFRALDFQPAEARGKAAAQIAFASDGLGGARSKFILVEAMSRVPANELQTADRKAALHRALNALRGTGDFLQLVDRANASDRYPELLAEVVQTPDSQFAVDAMKLLLSKDAKDLLSASLWGQDDAAAVATAKAMGLTADARSAGWLRAVVVDDKRPQAVRQEAARGMAKSKPGAQQLLKLIEEKKLADDLVQTAAFSLQTCSFGDVKAAALTMFPPPPSRNDQPIPPLDRLFAMRGDAARGKVVFNGAGKCNTCHVVSGEGKDVGPNLTEIGSKLSREAMFESILYPSAGISHNFETYSVVLKDGTSSSGVLTSQTNESVTLKGADALSRTFKRSDIDEFVKQKISLMPADLQKTMTVDELVDVVELLQTLKKK